MIYLITDTHLGHMYMIESCGRPANFSDLIIRNWAKKVKPADTVIHLGDVAWTDEYMSRLLKLPGKKFLIRGNHDKKTTLQYIEMGFDFCADQMLMNFDGTTVLFSHRPTYWHDAGINIHGHFHDLHVEERSRLYLPLSLEHIGYRPLALDKNMLRNIHRWVATSHQPTVEEMIAAGQNYLGEPQERDLYGFGRYKQCYERAMDKRDMAKDLIQRAGLMEYKGNPLFCKLVEQYVDGHISEDNLISKLNECLIM